MNIRRKLLVALGAGTLAAPLASFAQQQGKIWRVGYLSPRRRPVSLDTTDLSDAFSQGMRALGYVEGNNLVIERRYADGKYEQLLEFAAEMVQLKVDVIVAAGSQAISAAQKATSTIPIVMGSVTDPIGGGFVASLARPGGNITGLALFTEDLSPKFLEMLLSMVPKLSRVAILFHPLNAGDHAILKSVQAAGQRAGITVLPMETRTPQEIENAFSMMPKGRAGAVIVALDAMFIQQQRQIAELAAKNRLPSVAGFRTFTEVGGLMSYGTNLVENYRRAATYVDKIFKGAKPAELPVEQPTKFELVINGKTSKALGLKIPQSLLIGADMVIE